MARERYDAVVVGAGHNGLVTASYLAKAGLRTLVLERRSRAGGLLATEEVAPGVRAPVAADCVGGLRDDVVRDLGLGSHGFRAIEPEVAAFAPSADGPGLTLWRDPVRTATELRTGTRPRDAEAFVAFDRRIRSLGAFLARVQATEPPDLASPSLADATGGLTLLNGLRHLGRQQLREALRVLPMSVADLVGEAVEDEALRGVLGARGVRYAAMGPRSAGTALNFLWDSAPGGGAAGRTVFARGGPDSLVEALVAAARSNGATIRRDADVAAIRTGRGSVEGVALASGEEIDARIVVSNADPKQTLLRLVDPAEVGPTLGWRVENIRTPGVVAKVTLVLEGLPAIGGVDGERLHGRIVVAPSLDDLERAFDDSKYGRISEHPYLEATIPTLSDPSLAPDGTHVITALFQYAPRQPPRRGLGRGSARSCSGRGRADARGLCTGYRGQDRRSPRRHACGPRARVRAQRRAPDARRARPRPVLRLAAPPRPCSLPACRDPRPLHVWGGHTPRGRGHRRPREERSPGYPGRRPASSTPQHETSRTRGLSCRSCGWSDA